MLSVIYNVFAEASNLTDWRGYDLDASMPIRHRPIMPRLQKTRPDIVAPILWREAITMAMEGGPLD
jgi:hypothetical protein